MKNFIICLAVVFSLLTSIPAFCAVELSDKEIRQIEAKIRQDFQQQRGSVENSLLGIAKELDAFLFGPEVTSNLLTFFNKHVKNGQIQDQEKLWALFKEEVLSKERFDKFIDELIEIHFRVFDKARKEVNRDLISYGLDGVQEQNYDDIKEQLKAEIDKIWNIQAEKMQEIIGEASLRGNETNTYKRNDSMVYKSILAIDVVQFFLATSDSLIKYHPVLSFISIAINGGWTIFQMTKGQQNYEDSIDITQQQFMREMEKQLKILSEETQAQFKIASEAATERLFDAIRKAVVETYPQIREEELR